MSIYLFFLPLLIPSWSYFVSDHPGKRVLSSQFWDGWPFLCSVPSGRTGTYSQAPFSKQMLPGAPLRVLFSFLLALDSVILLFQSHQNDNSCANIQVARIGSYFITVDSCLNICLFFPSTLKIKIFLDIYLHFPTLTKTLWKGEHCAGCYTRIHLQLEDTSTLHFEQLHLKLRGLEAISGLQHIQFWPISD